MATVGAGSGRRSRRITHPEFARASGRHPFGAAAAMSIGVTVLLLTLASGLIWTVTRNDDASSSAGAAPTVPVPPTVTSVAAPRGEITVTVSVMGGGTGLVSHVANKIQADLPEERVALPWEQTITIGPDDHMVISGTPDNPDTRLICSIQVNGQLVTSDDSAVSAARYCSAAASNEDLRVAQGVVTTAQP